MSSKKETTHFNRYLKIFWILVAVPIIALVLIVAGTAAGWFGALPTFEELENPNSSLASEVISGDNAVLGKYFIQNRSNIHYRELPQNLVNALKAVSYTHL